MKENQRKDRLLFLTGETRLTTRQRKGLKKRALEMGCKISICRNFAGVGESVKPAYVKLIITLNYTPKLIPTWYDYKPTPILHVFYPYKITPQEVEKIKRDQFNNFLLLVKRIDQQLIFRKILDIRYQKQNHDFN